MNTKPYKYITWCFLVCPRPPEIPLATADVQKEEFNIGEEITYHCNPGYVPYSGARRYTCPWSGRWPIVTFRCIRKYIPSIMCLAGFFAYHNLFE